MTWKVRSLRWQRRKRVIAAFTAVRHTTLLRLKVWLFALFMHVA
jgi:hypothetical protein